MTLASSLSGILGSRQATGLALACLERREVATLARASRETQNAKEPSVSPEPVPSRTSCVSGVMRTSNELSKIPVPKITSAARPGDSQTPKTHGVKPPTRGKYCCSNFDPVLSKPRLEPGSKNSRDRETAIRKWLCIIGHDLASSSLGDMSRVISAREVLLLENA